jgi:uncharacterized lipoprotein YmbA
MRRRLWLPLLLVLACAGCGSTPTQYYVLQPRPAQANVAPPSAGQQPIVVRHVVISAELDRQSYVSYGAGGALSIAHDSQWGAPMGRMIQAVIASDLSADLPGRVPAPGDPPPQGPHQTLAVTIRHFAADADGRVRLVADWTLLGSDGRHLAASSASIQRQAPSASPQEVVPLMNEALAEFAARIARAIPQQE